MRQGRSSVHESARWQEEGENRGRAKTCASATNTTRLRRVTAAGEFGRGRCCFGGDSSRREISLLSGNAVCDARPLKRRGTDRWTRTPAIRAMRRSTRGVCAARRRFGPESWIEMTSKGGRGRTRCRARSNNAWGMSDKPGAVCDGIGIGMDKLRTKRGRGPSGVATAIVVITGAQIATGRARAPSS